MVYTENPIKCQDMVDHAFGRFKDMRIILPPRQRKIYENLAVALDRKSTLEAGCGIGLGTTILKRLDDPFLHNGKIVQRIVIGTDKELSHVEFAIQMHPAVEFDLWDITEGSYPAKLYDAVVAIEVIEHIDDYRTALENLILTCRQEVWISTPNRNNDEISDVQPVNHHHVREFTPEEIIECTKPLVSSIELRHWEDFSILPIDTDVTPLVYRLVL